MKKKNENGMIIKFFRYWNMEKKLQSNYVTVRKRKKNIRWNKKRNAHKQVNKTYLHLQTENKKSI